MRTTLSVIILIISLLTSFCTKQELTDEKYYDKINFVVKNNSLNSRALEYNELSNTDKILVNSIGNVTIKDEQFEYSLDSWCCRSNDYVWDKSNKSNLILSMLYPATKNSLYTAKELYHLGRLQDILFTRDTIPYRNNIVVTFKHLFSKLTINLGDNIKKDISNIYIIENKAVDTINKITGDFVLKDSLITSSINITDDNNYIFISPPDKNKSLKIIFEYKDGTKIEKNIIHEFYANTNYIYEIKDSDDEVGISSAEELIAFSRLINGYTINKEWTLSTFGITEDETTTYKLLNDIYLTPDESKDLMPIGIAHHEFKDIFDGQGHTIRKINIQQSPINTYMYGIFINIDSKGVVKNLIIDEPYLNILKTKSTNVSAGIIAYRNKGLVDNCVIRNCTINSKSAANIGCISGILMGNITNCGIESCKITVDEKCYVGFISGIGNGKIVNCYASNSRLKDNSKKTILGGLLGSCQNVNNENTIIANSFTNIGFEYAANTGNLVGIAKNLTFINCLLPLNDSRSVIIDKIIGENPKFDVLRRFNAEFKCKNDTSLIYYLNKWIEDNPKYIDKYNLKRWKRCNDSIPAVHLK